MARKKGVNTVRVQAVLNKQFPLEQDAIEIRRRLMEADGDLWEDRKLITEGLIALWEKMEHGYTPPKMPKQAAVLNQVAAMVAKLDALTNMLQNVDLTAARQQPHWNEEVFQDAAGIDAPGLRKRAVQMFSSSDEDVPDDW